jgi:hypothetical protein
MRPGTHSFLPPLVNIPCQRYKKQARKRPEKEAKKIKKSLYKCEECV